jgi:hypothetical protein
MVFAIHPCLVWCLARRHPFFCQLITNLKSANRFYGSAYPTVFFSTGPAFVTLQYVADGFTYPAVTDLIASLMDALMV